MEYLETPTVNCFACMKLHSLEEAQAAVKEKMGSGAYCFAIELKDTGKVIGEIEAHPESSQPDKAENYAMDTFSPCWMLNPAYQGKGYAFEAAHERLGQGDGNNGNRMRKGVRIAMK